MISGLWFRIAPETQLVAVAGEVVLVAQHLQRIAFQRFHARPAASRTGCGRSRSRPVSSSFSYIGKSTIQAEGEAVFVEQAKLLRDHVARPPATSKARRLAGEEERRVALAEAKLLSDRLGPLGPDVLGERPGADHLAVPPRARRCSPSPAAPPSAPRSSSGRRTCGCRRPWARDRADLGALVLQELGEDREARAAKCSETSCILIGLRRSGLSVPYHFSAASA
jgi:hypothetical protein